jgi:hypothetical protein
MVGWTRGFLTSALVGDELLHSGSGRFIPEGRAPGTHCVGDWVGAETALTPYRREILDTIGTRTTSLDRPAPSQ